MSVEKKWYVDTETRTTTDDEWHQKVRLSLLDSGHSNEKWELWRIESKSKSADIIYPQYTSNLFIYICIIVSRCMDFGSITHILCHEQWDERKIKHQFHFSCNVLLTRVLFHHWNYIRIIFKTPVASNSTTEQQQEEQQQLDSAIIVFHNPIVAGPACSATTAMTSERSHPTKKTFNERK